VLLSGEAGIGDPAEGGAGACTAVALEAVVLNRIFSDDEADAITDYELDTRDIAAGGAGVAGQLEALQDGGVQGRRARHVGIRRDTGEVDEHEVVVWPIFLMGKRTRGKQVNRRRILARRDLQGVQL